MNQLINLFSASSSSVFLKYDNKTESYKSYLETSAALAKEYFSDIKKPTVCIVAKDSRLYFYCFMAVLLCGGRVVPIDNEKTEKDIDELINIIEPDYIVSDKTINNREVLSIDADALAWENDYSECINMLSNIDTESEYLITFTSGTTQEPKGVVHSFGNLYSSAKALGALFSFNHKSVFYHNFPVSYMAGILNQFIVPMIFGAQISIGNRFNIQQALRFWKLPVKHSVNVFWMSPTMLRLLLSMDKDGAGKEYCSQNSVTILVATAPLPVSLRKEFEIEFGVQLYESYGLTETLFNATNHPGRAIRDGCVGLIIPGVRPEVAIDEELILSCDWMFIRYFHAAQAHDKAFSFATGDFALIDDDGYLQIVGRKKDLIIRGGMNVSPSRIEAEIDRHWEEGDFSIIGLPDSVLGEKTTLVYEACSTLSTETEKSINKQIISRLGKDYSIDGFIRVDIIPKNKNGKTDKNALRELVLNDKSAEV